MGKRSSRARIALAVPAFVAALAAGAAGAEAAGRKDGPFMANLKVGPAIKLDDFPTQFSMEVEVAYAVDRGNNAYIAFAPQFQFSDPATIINLPLAFQYDIELPVKGLYLYPRLAAGVGILLPRVGNTQAAFTLQPEFGIKYQVVDNFHIGFEPFSLPMYMADFFDLQYRLYFYGGIDL